MRRSLLAVTAAAALLSLGGVVQSADAARAKHYKSCKALNKVYPHGVGRKGARDRTSALR